MTELGGDTASGGTAGKVVGAGGRRQRYYGDCANICILTVNVATRCPEVDPKCTRMRPAKLFIEGRQKVWLSIDDVEWALTYLFAQNQLKGVPLVCDDDAGPGAVLHA